MRVDKSQGMSEDMDLEEEFYFVMQKDNSLTSKCLTLGRNLVDYRTKEMQQFSLCEYFFGRWSRKDGKRVSAKLSEINENSVVFQKLDSDVYPFSMQNSQEELNTIKCKRIGILVTILLLLFVGDYWLRQKDQPFRFHYFYNRKIETKIKLAELPAAGLKLDLMNCGIQLQTHMKRDHVLIESNTPLVLVPTYQNGVFKAHDQNDAAVKCRLIVNLPSNQTGVVLPSLTIQSSGQNVIQKLQMFDLSIPSTHSLNFGGNHFNFNGTLMYIHMKGEHKMGSFTATFTKGGADVRNIISPKVKIHIGEGNINFITRQNYTQLTSTEVNSQMCISGDTVTHTSSNTYCIANLPASKKLTLPTTEPDPEKLCTVTANICNGTCMGAPTSVVDLKVVDGSVQFKQNEGKQSYSLLRDHVELNYASIQRVKEIQTHVKDIGSDDILYILDVFMPEEKFVWMYSTKQAYIIARPWVLSVVSLTVINPKIERYQLYMSHSACPGRPKTTDLSKDISRDLKSYLHPENQKKVGILVERKKGGVYFEYEQQKKDAKVDREVQFYDGQFFMIFTLVLSFIVSIYSTVIIIYGISKGILIGDKIFNRYLKSQMKLLKAKSITKSSQLQSEEYLDHIKKHDLKKCFCHEKFKLKKKLNQEENDNSLDNTALFRFGIFQCASMYVEYLRRKNTNSLRKFIEDNIIQSPSHFPHRESRTQEVKSVPYVPYTKFNSKYKEYCLKFGFQPYDIEESIHMLDRFGITVETIQLPDTAAYLKIRWKRDEELIKGVDENSKQSAISQFIRNNCVITGLDHDYILANELQQRYEKFITKMFGFQKEYEPIVGSSELDKFGLSKKNIPIKVVKNVATLNPVILESTRRVHTKDTRKLFQTGMVRVPDHDFRPWYDYQKYTQKYRPFQYLKKQLTSHTGIVINFLQVLLHLGIIAAIIIPINVLSAWMMLEETQYDSDPFVLGFDETDILYADYERFWFTSLKTELKVYLIVQLCISGLYVLLCMINLLFYYTSLMTNQNYTVKRSRTNAIINFGFRSMTFMFLFLYLSYGCMFLIWWMLGAIINPEKFLPYATTSVSFISYVIYKYNNLKDFYNELEKVVMKEVSKHMVKIQKEVTKTIFNKESQVFDEDDENQSLDQLIKRSGREIFIFTFLNVFDKDIGQLDQGLRARLMDGEQEAYVELLSQIVGIHPAISLATLGVLKKDRQLMLESAEQFARKFDLSENMCKTITDICIEEYIPGHHGVNEPPKSTIMKIKPLFYIFFYDLNPSLLEGLLGIVFEKSGIKMMDFLQEVNTKYESHNNQRLLPLELFHLLIHQQGMKNSVGIAGQLKEIVSQVVKVNIKQENQQVMKEEDEEDENKDKQVALNTFISDLIDIYMREFDYSSKCQEIMKQGNNKVREAIIHFHKLQSTPPIDDSIQMIRNDILCLIYITPHMSQNEQHMKYISTQILYNLNPDEDESFHKIQYQNFSNLYNFISHNSMNSEVYNDYSKQSIQQVASNFSFRNLRMAAQKSRQDFLKFVIRIDLQDQYELMNEFYIMATSSHDDISIMSYTMNALRLPTHYSHHLHQIIHFFSQYQSPDKEESDEVEVEEIKDEIQDDDEKEVHELIKDETQHIDEKAYEFNKQSPLYREFANYYPFLGEGPKLYYQIKGMCKNRTCLKYEALKYAQASSLKTSSIKDQRMILYQMCNELTPSQMDGIFSLSILLYAIRGMKQDKNFKPQKKHSDYLRAIQTLAQAYQIEESQLQLVIDVLTGKPEIILQTNQKKLEDLLKKKSEGSTEQYECTQPRVYYLSKIMNLDVVQFTYLSNQWISESQNKSDQEVIKFDMLNAISQISKLLDNENNAQSLKSYNYHRNLIIEKLAQQVGVDSESPMMDLIQGKFISTYIKHLEDKINDNSKTKDKIKVNHQAVQLAEDLVLASFYPVKGLQMLLDLLEGDVYYSKKDGTNKIDVQTEEYLLEKKEEQSVNRSIHHVCRNKTITSISQVNKIDLPKMYLKTKFKMFQMIILLNHQQIKDRFVSTDVDQSTFNIFKENLLKLIPEDLKKKVFNQVLNTTRLQRSMIESGIFTGMGELLFKVPKEGRKEFGKIISDNENDYQSVFNLIFAHKIGYQQMIIQSIQDLISDCKDRFLLEGILAMSLKDFTKEQEIYYASKKLGLNPGIMSTILSLTAHDYKTIAHNLKYSLKIKQSQIIACLLSLRMEQQSVSFIANRLKLDSMQLNMILSFGYRQKHRSSPYYQKLCELYGFRSKNDVKAIVETTQGYTNQVKYIQQNMRSFTCMSFKDMALAEALVFLISTGREVRKVYENCIGGRLVYTNVRYSNYELDKHLVRIIHTMFDDESEYVIQLYQLCKLLWRYFEYEVSDNQILTTGAHQRYILKMLNMVDNDFECPPVRNQNDEDQAEVLVKQFHVCFQNLDQELVLETIRQHSQVTEDVAITYLTKFMIRLMFGHWTINTHFRKQSLLADKEIKFNFKKIILENRAKREESKEPVPKQAKFDIQALDDYLIIPLLIRKDDKVYDENIDNDESRLHADEEQIISDPTHYSNANQDDLTKRVQKICTFAALANGDFGGLLQYGESLIDDLQLNTRINPTQKIRNTVLFDIISLSNSEFIIKLGILENDRKVQQKITNKIDKVQKDQRILVLQLLKNMSPKELFKIFIKHRENQHKDDFTESFIITFLKQDLNMDSESINNLERLLKVVQGRLTDEETFFDMLPDGGSEIKESHQSLYLQLCSIDPTAFSNAVNSKLKIEFPDLTDLVVNVHNFMYGPTPHKSLHNILLSRITKYYILIDKDSAGLKVKDEKGKRVIVDSLQTQAAECIKNIVTRGYKLISGGYMDLTSQVDRDLFIINVTRHLKPEKQQILLKYNKIFQSSLSKIPWKSVEDIDNMLTLDPNSDKLQKLFKSNLQNCYQSIQLLSKVMVDYPQKTTLGALHSHSFSKSVSMSQFDRSEPEIACKGIGLIFKRMMEDKYQFIYDDSYTSTLFFNKLVQSQKGNTLALMEVLDYIQSNTMTDDIIGEYSCVSIYNMLTHKSPIKMYRGPEGDRYVDEHLITPEVHVTQARQMMKLHVNGGEIPKEGANETYYYGLLYLATRNVKYLHYFNPYEVVQSDGDSLQKITGDQSVSVNPVSEVNTKKLSQLIHSFSTKEDKNQESVEEIGELLGIYIPNDDLKQELKPGNEKFVIHSAQANEFCSQRQDGHDSDQFESDQNDNKSDQPPNNLSYFCSQILQCLEGDTEDALLVIVNFMKKRFTDNILLTKSISCLIDFVKETQFEKDSFKRKDLPTDALKNLPSFIYLGLVVEKVLSQQLTRDEDDVSDDDAGGEPTLSELILPQIKEDGDEEVKGGDVEDGPDVDLELDERFEISVWMIQSWLMVSKHLFRNRYSKSQARDLRYRLVKALQLSVKFQQLMGVKPGNMIIKNEDQAKKAAILMTGIVLLMKGNFDSIGELANELGGYDEKKINYVIGFLRDYLSIFGAQLKMNDKSKTNTIKDMSKNLLTGLFSVASGNTEDYQTTDQLFTHFDKDNSGYIDFNEFMDVCKYMGINMSKSDMMTLFTKSDRDDSNQISQVEFRDAIMALRSQIAESSLAKIGISRENLLKVFIVGVVYLVFIFIFIFLGIAAFSDGGSFSSIVNSIMPILAGLRLASMNNPKVEQLMDELKEAIRLLFKQLKQ